MLRQCLKGHLYDDEKYEACPYCVDEFDPKDNFPPPLYASPNPSEFRPPSNNDSISGDYASSFVQPLQLCKPTPFDRFTTNGAGNRQSDFQSFVENQINVLAALKKMLDAGLIMQSDYDEKKAEVLSRL